MLPCALHHLHEIRATELSAVFERHRSLFEGTDVLEIGAGTGLQLRIIRQLARSAVGIDVPSSEYQPSPLDSVMIFDGANLPFAERSFDLVYSSNTMEHVTNEPALHREMQRVLRPGGVAIHVVPSSSWRLWTMLTHYLRVPKLAVEVARRYLETSSSNTAKPLRISDPKSTFKLIANTICAPRHGERGNRLSEWWHFRGASWKRRFEELDWRVDSVEGIGLFYTGYMIAPRFMSIERRKRWSRLLGSACLVCVMRPSSIIA